MLIHSAVITGSVQLNNTDVSSITNVAGFATTSSVDSLVVKTGSYATTSSVNNLQSVTGSYATTGSNQFNGNQSISGSIVSNGTITAQTLVVQTVTSSIEFVTGSTRNGSLSSNTHEFTGSVSITGSATTLLSINNSVLFVSSSGNVGIGTTSPSFKLDVNGTARVSGVLTGSSAAIFSGNITADGGTPVVLTGTGTVNIWGSRVILRQNGAALNRAELYSDNGIQLTTNSGFGVVIPNGNVGIGTTSPSGSLHIIGTNATNRGQLSIQSNNVSNAARVSFYYDTTLQGNIGTTSGDFYVEAVNNLFLLSGGNVGVGTYTPAAKLDVNGSIGHSNGSNFKAFEFFKTISASTSATNLYTVTLNNANRAVFYEVIVFGADWSGHSAARTIKRGFFCPNGSYTPHNVIESSGVHASNITLGYSQSGNAFTTTLTLYSGTTSLDCHIRIVGDVASYS